MTPQIGKSNLIVLNKLDFYCIKVNEFSYRKAVAISPKASRFMNLIQMNIDKITALCKKYRVKTLSVFGSILTDRFNEDSDVDFLVDFEPYNPDNPDFDCLVNYLDLADSLEDVLQRKVDLVVEKAMRNKYFIANVNRTKQLIYG